MKKTRELLNNLLKGIPVSDKDKEAAKKEIEETERDLRVAKISVIVYQLIALASFSLLVLAR